MQGTLACLANERTTAAFEQYLHGPDQGNATRLAGIAAIVAVPALGMLLARQATRPVHELAKAAYAPC